MEFFEVIKKRRCVRRFDSKKSVSDADIEKIIDAGNRAPSAGGFYPTKFTVLKGAEIKKLSSAIPERMHWFLEAPITVVVWSDPRETIEYYKERGKNLYIIQDAAAAAENIFLATIALELNTCWIGTFNEDEVRNAIDLTSNQIPYVIMPIGYEK